MASNQQSQARMKFFIDTKRCIECGGCEGGGKNETNVPIPCMHCSKAPCVAVCPVDALFTRQDGIVQVNKDTCIGCGYCLYACPFGAPQFPTSAPFGARGVMDKCTYCAGGPEEPHSQREQQLYGSNRVADGKLPMCAS